MDLGREAFALVAETGTDHDRTQVEAAQRKANCTKDAKAQWWFEQMRLSVERAQ